MNDILSSSNAFDIQIAHSVTEVGADAWDYLSAGHPFASYHWYRYAETVLPTDSPFYIILSCGGEPVARSTFWISRNEPLRLPPILRRIFWAYLHRRPMFICRTPLVDLPGMILPAMLPLQVEALQIITREAQAYARQHAVSFLIYDYLEQAQTQLAGWPPEYFSAEAGGASTILTFSDTDFANYLKRLSRATRDSYRWNRNNAARRGITVRRYEKIIEVNEALTLMDNTARHHHSTPEPWARAMLENMEQVGAIWLAAELQGQMISGCLFLQDGSYGVLKLLARDYAVPFAYFALVYEALGCALESGVQVLRGGSGAYAFKESLGFQVDSNQYVMATTDNLALRWLIRCLAGNYAQ